MKDFLPYLPIFASAVPSCLMAWIAWQQKHVAAQKLKLDLFDRRYRVFDATRKMLEIIVINRQVKPPEILEFRIATSDSQFLFGNDVIRFVEDLAKMANDLGHIQVQIQEEPVGPERHQHFEAKTRALDYFADRLGALGKTFAPYLGLVHKG